MSSISKDHPQPVDSNQDLGSIISSNLKRLIAQFSEEDPVIAQNIFNCVRDINLRTVLGCHKDGVYYNF